MAVALNRQTFTTSRLAEFFSEKELQQQIGYPKELWPLALLKELIDNALDAELAVIRAVQRIGELTPKEQGKRNDFCSDGQKSNADTVNDYKAHLLSDHPDIVDDIIEKADPNKRLTVNGVSSKVRKIVKARETGQQPEPTFKEFAHKHMEAAYMKASANGTLPANARQIMYAIRPLVLADMGTIWSKSSYFTQHLLPDYMRDHPSTEGWDVVFDARGHFLEPHTEHSLGLGTVEVRRYLRDWKSTVTDDEKLPVHVYRATTHGPANRYSAALFIEKEGFMPLLEQAQIANRFDIAIMSTKGMSVTAARQLVERLSRAGVTIYVVRDFDKSGFAIVASLRKDTRRYSFSTRPNVVDLGLRLEDVQDMSLDSEPVDCDGSDTYNLRQNGATNEEIAFLTTGERVELNAMTSDQFIDWLEEKLTEKNVVKVVPDEDTLKTAYGRARLLARVNQAIKVLDIGRSEEVPADLLAKVRSELKDDDTASWDQIIWSIAEEYAEPSDTD